MSPLPSPVPIGSVSAGGMGLSIISIGGGETIWQGANAHDEDQSTTSRGRVCRDRGRHCSACGCARAAEALAHGYLMAA
jgi:hypothetical protein